MGNSNEKQNAQFGKNYNMAQHNRKMAEMRGNYNEHSLNIQREGLKVNAPKEQSYSQMSRKNAIFKPSINISMNNQINISLEYNSQNGCQLQIFLGVNNINQDLQKKNTTEIQSDYKLTENLSPGKKQSFRKSYPNYDSNLSKKQVIIRIFDQNEATEYSLRRVNQKQEHWKIILEKFQIDGRAYELQNIYGSGDGGQECIVCMSQPSSTLVKPCNHMCLCKQCAVSVSTKTNKCPICRNQITDLVTLNTKQ